MECGRGEKGYRGGRGGNGLGSRIYLFWLLDALVNRLGHLKDGGGDRIYKKAEAL